MKILFAQVENVGSVPSSQRKEVIAMEIYGYVRVSSTDQNEDRQMRALCRQKRLYNKCWGLKKFTK